MLKNLSLAIALAGVALVSAAPAQALSFYYKPGAQASNLGGTVLFEDFESATVGDPYGGGNGIFDASVAGVAARPAFGSVGNFLAVQADNTSSITVGVGNINVLSFVIGSLDDYNELVLNFLSGASITLRGNQINSAFGTPYIPGAATGNTTDAASNGRVFYDTEGLDAITSFTLFSDGANAFEIDNISVAAPEPATWGMMLLTAGIAGAALRARRKQASLA